MVWQVNIVYQFLNLEAFYTNTTKGILISSGLLCQLMRVYMHELIVMFLSVALHSWPEFKSNKTSNYQSILACCELYEVSIMHAKV